MTARDQTEDAVHLVLDGYSTRGYTVSQVADAASDVWEPLVKQLLQNLLAFDRTSFIDPALRRSAARSRKAAIRKAEEALG